MENCWERMSGLEAREMSGSTTLTLKKRKSIGSRIGAGKSSASLFSSNTPTGNLVELEESLSSLKLSDAKLRLIRTDLKDLTLIELKYLKQICYNKLQKVFQQMQSEQQQMRKQLSNSGLLNTNSSASSSAVRLNIPKGNTFQKSKR